MNTRQDRFLSYSEMRDLTGKKSRATYWRWIKAGIFPKAHKIGPYSNGWLDSEITDWRDKITKNQNVAVMHREK